MSKVYKMPSTTSSKIPLPKSSISSPSRSEVVSRIPVMKVGTTNKENISVELPSSHNCRVAHLSRIPDIRTKISPTKDIQADHNTLVRIFKNSPTPDYSANGMGPTHWFLGTPISFCKISFLIRALPLWENSLI